MRDSVGIDVGLTLIVGSAVINEKDVVASTNVEYPPEGTSSDRGVDETVIGMDTPQPVRNVLRGSSQARTHLIVKA